MINTASPGEPLEEAPRGVLMGRYSEYGQVLLEGEATGLLLLAKSLKNPEALAWNIDLEIPPGLQAAPYHGFLRCVKVEIIENSLLMIERSATTLAIKGPRLAITNIALSIGYLAEEIQKSASGQIARHIHIDRYAFLRPEEVDKASEELVVSEWRQREETNRA